NTPQLRRSICQVCPWVRQINNNFSIVDVFEIQFTDTVESTSNQNFTITGFNKVGSIVTGKSVSASVYNGNDNDDDFNNDNSRGNILSYRIPPALGTAMVQPRVAYTTTTSFSMQSRILLQNKAVAPGSNRIFRAQITLPAGVTVANASDVTPRTGTTVACAGGDGFTAGCSGPGESITLDHTTATPSYLDPNGTSSDEVLVLWSHNLSAEGNLVFGINFDNNDGNGFAANLEAVPAALRTVELVNEPTIRIEVISKPGDPANPASLINDQTANVIVPETSYHRFRLFMNANSGSKKIHRIRITPPSPFIASSLDSGDLLPAGTTMTVSGSDLLVSFATAELSAATVDLEFRLQENRNFNTPGVFDNSEDYSWPVSVAYFEDLYDNGVYAENNLPGPSFTGKLNSDGVNDALHYFPGNAFGNARNIIPVSGTGSASLNWNVIRLVNPAPRFMSYVDPEEVIRINPGDPDYTWSQSVYFENKLNPI
ncbi:MAG TPA: hypothetical protein PLY93_05190, partial [Turneriella sp.]|nr:hypothetical protein [Turneriella sp.]